MPQPAPGIAFVLLMAVMSAAAWTDWTAGKVYNRLTYPAVLLGLLYWLLAGAVGWDPAGPWGSLGRSAVAMLAGFVPMFLIFHLGALGGGDVKVMAAVGAISANLNVVLGTAFYGLILAFIMAVWLMVRKGLVRRTLQRIAGAAVMTAAKVQAEFPKDSPTVPLSAAFKVGALLSGMEHLLGIGMPWSKWV